MSRINFTESQFEIVKHLNDASYQRGIFMGILYSVSTVVGIAAAVKLTLVFEPLIF